MVLLWWMILLFLRVILILMCVLGRNLVIMLKCFDFGDFILFLYRGCRLRVLKIFIVGLEILKMLWVIFVLSRRWLVLS